MTQIRKILLLCAFALISQPLWWGIMPASADKRLLIYTVNYPLQYFAQRIGDDAVEVELPVPAGVDPAFWKPDTQSILALQRADLILLNGAGYAKWLDKVSLPGHKLVDTSAGFRDRYIEVQTGVSHSHGPGGEHSHAGTAFTTWLDFGQAVEQARAVKDALTRLNPLQEKTFATRFAALERDLNNLNSELQAIVAQSPSKPLLASHPVYQYLVRRYSLDLQSVLWEPDSMPPDSEWQSLEALLAEHPARWMLWEARPTAEITEHLIQSGVQVAVFDPCANRPPQGDFLSVMSDNIANLKPVFESRVE